MKNRLIKLGLILGIILINYWLEIITFSFNVLVNTK